MSPTHPQTDNRDPTDDDPLKLEGDPAKVQYSCPMRPENLRDAPGA